jgi:hypothetical protein
MKAALSLLIFAATINLARAGDFAGPPPFTNESPLTSGTDGTYQAVAEGVNLTGVFSFVISGGIQTSDQNPIINGWVFFVDGNIFTGSVVAAISEDDVAGVLNGEVTSQGVPTGTNGTVTLPTAFIIRGDTASGEFSGSISLNSPVGEFVGDGTLQGTPGRTDQLIVITDPTTVIAGGTTTTNVSANTNNPIFQTNIVIQQSTVGRTVGRIEFEFEGTRVSTTPATVPVPTASPSPTPGTTSTGTTTSG